MASITPFLRHWLAIVFVQALASECGGLVLVQDYIDGPRDVMVRRGESVAWPCRPIPEFEASKEFNVTWRFNGQPIRNDSRKYVRSDGSLFFKRVRRTDNTEAGDVYDCILQNGREKMISRPAKLYVAELLYIEESEEGTSISNSGGVSRKSASSDENIDVRQGETVWLNCHISVTPPHAQPTYEWEKDKTLLPPDPRHKILPSGVLEIRDVQLGDQGRYRCSASLAHDSRNSRQIQLTVTQGSDQSEKIGFLHDRMQTLTVMSGEKVVLPCAASGLPQPTLTWSLANGTAVDYTRFSRIGQGSLEISNATRYYNGTYICSAFNSRTTKPINSTLVLRVLEPPKVLEQFHLKESYKVAQFVSLTCNLSGFPAPTITWYHNAKPISNGGRFTLVGSNSLHLTNSIATDSGYFQCQGDNGGGIAQITGHIEFVASDNAASPPMDLSVEDVTSDSILVKWSSNEAIFSVHQYTQGGVEETVVSGETQHRINNLLPHTNYTIYVIAYNNAGASQPSQKIVQLTADAAPIAAPKPKVTPLGGRSVKVEWNKLQPHEARGLVTEYKVIYRIKGSPSEYVEAVSGDTTEVVLNGLDPSKVYEVCVKAKTVGFNPDDKNQWVDVRTGGPSDIAAPENLEVQSNSSALKLSWEYNGPAISSFSLRYHKRSELTSKPPVDVTKNLSADSRHYVITPLEPSTWYKISLMVRSTSGDLSAPLVRESSTTGKDGGIATPGQYPPQPVNVVARPHNSTAIDLEWHIPDSVDTYIIRYYKVTNGPDEGSIKTIRSRGTRERVRIDGLEEYTEYEFQVQAEKGNHRGPPSKDVRCRTDEGIATPPRDVQLSLKGDTTVGIDWQPPAKPNGRILLYTVFFKNGDHLDKEVSITSWNHTDSWNRTVVNGSAVTADVKHLNRSMVYTFRVAALTGGGTGMLSEAKRIQTKDAALPTDTPTNLSQTQNKKMGIIIGVSIGGACIIVSIIIILLRNRCLPARAPPAEPVTRRVNGNSYIPNVNGNGFGPHTGNVRLSSESHESYPMLPQTQIPENQHSDTRGGIGHPVMNGIYPINMNGVRVNLQPNGHVRSMPIFAESDADKPQVPQRSSSLLATQEESQRLVRNNSMDSIDHEEDTEPANGQDSRHSDSGSHSDRHNDCHQRSTSATGPSNSSECQQQPNHQTLQEQQPPISATSSQKQQKQQQQHGEHNSPKMPSSTSSVNGNASHPASHPPSSGAAGAGRPWDREGLDQPVGAGDGASHDTSSTKLLPASGRHDHLPHV